MRLDSSVWNTHEFYTYLIVSMRYDSWNNFRNISFHFNLGRQRDILRGCKCFDNILKFRRGLLILLFRGWLHGLQTYLNWLDIFMKDSDSDNVCPVYFQKTRSLAIDRNSLILQNVFASISSTLFIRIARLKVILF